MKRLAAAALVAIVAVIPARAADWPPADDYVNSLVNCSASTDAANCEYTRSVWAKQYGDAITGDYQGQRNVSFCLSTGCNKAIIENHILGCAWRQVILKAGHLQIDQTDVSNLKHFCGDELLDDAGRRAANAQATRLLGMLPQTR